MLQPAPDVISEVLEDEVVMIDLKRGIYYRVRGSGAAAWRGISAGATTDQITAAFDPGEDNPSPIAAAVIAFTDALVTEGLLIDGPDRPPVTDDDWLPAGTTRLPFAPLALERFDDMANVLLADPIHDVDPDMGWPSKR